MKRRNSVRIARKASRGLRVGILSMSYKHDLGARKMNCVLAQSNIVIWMNHVLTEQFNLLPIEQLWGNVNFCGTKMVVMKCFGKLHCSTLEVGQNNKKSHETTRRICNLHLINIFYVSFSLATNQWFYHKFTACPNFVRNFSKLSTLFLNEMLYVLLSERRSNQPFLARHSTQMDTNWIFCVKTKNRPRN